MTEMMGLTPALLVRDLEETLAFYERLGFETTGCHPQTEPNWAEVTRSGVTLQFHTRAPHSTPLAPIFSGTFYIAVADVDELAGEFQDHVEFAWGPEAMDYGLYEFGIRDPNGYYLAFSRPTTRGNP